MVKTRCIQAQPDDIATAVRALNEGRIVAFPTDTVYGVGAHAFVPAAVRRLYEVKIRLPDKAIPLLISDAAILPQVARDVPLVAYELAERFWPGALTLVLRRAPAISDEITAGGDTVGVRVPDHPITQALLRALGAPLATTSANLSGQTPAVNAEQVLAQLDGRIDLLLDGGVCPGGMASTVLDLTASSIRVLRPGPLLPELEAWL